MWRALFIGWLAIALAEEVTKDGEGAGVAKRQTARGNTVVYGASPGQYTIQTPDRAAHAQQQASADYQQQSELYVISPNRKPTALAYSSESPRRPQYIQLSALQLQAAQQVLQHQQLQQQQLQHQPQQQVSYEPEPGHGVLYRPAVRLQQQPQQEEEKPAPTPTPAQYAAHAILDSQLYPQAGSFERELAQLVAANRAQEQKYNAAAGLASRPLKKHENQNHQGPQQYLKEITRPVSRPVSPARLAPAPQQAHVQYQTLPQQPQQQLYRYVYQPEAVQIPSNSQQYKPSAEPQYLRPQVQQYLQQQPQAQSQSQGQISLASHQAHAQALRLRNEEDAQPGLRAHGISAARLAQVQAQAQAQAHAQAQAQAQAQPEAPSRSTIYVSQATPLKKPQYSLPQVAEREEEASKVPSVRLPAQRNRPLTQEEFQSILQAGGYTATLVPSNDPNSPHQEYLLHPTAAQTAQRPVYSNEKQEAVTYLLPQAHQRPVKRRPVYNVQQA